MDLYLNQFNVTMLCRLTLVVVHRSRNHCFTSQFKVISSVYSKNTHLFCKGKYHWVQLCCYVKIIKRFTFLIESKPVKQEVGHTVIVSLLWFTSRHQPINQCDQILRYFATQATFYKAFGHFLSNYLVFGKIVNLLWQIFYSFGQFFIVQYGQILKNNIAIWSHCESTSIISVF